MKQLTVAEELVMLAVFKLQGQAYSVTIHEKIREMTGKDLLVGTLFNVLRQLYGKGLLVKEELKTHGKPGRPIMLYSISDRGCAALDQTRAEHNRLWKGMPDALR